MEKGVVFSRKSQVTVFVIIAIVLVASISGYFLFKKMKSTEVPSDFAPVYNYYKSCVESKSLDSIKLLSSRGGFISGPEFTAGSQYAPFSNYLGFMGDGIPYWQYVSANGIVREQIPSVTQMENELRAYLDERISECDLSYFSSQGYEISRGSPKTKIIIKDKEIILSLKQDLSIVRGDSKISLSSHEFKIPSRLMEFYNDAKKIYNLEKNNMFLENYSLETLYAYAPVSGMEFNCSPVFWSSFEIFSTLKNALEANIQAIKIPGDYYTLNKDYGGYFVVKSGDLSIKNKQVRFLYSRDWPNRFEVWPAENNILRADPVGNQEGLGSLGFCYVPYKFVYDLYFPVLVQLYSEDGQEIFQFPISIVINKNSPREALASSEYVNFEESICDNINSKIIVNTYNMNLNPIEAEISYKCLTSSCNLGKTKLDNSTGIASLEVGVPQCTNAVIVAKAEGYSEKKYFLSTNEEDYADIVLNRLYDLPLEIYVDGKLTQDNGVLIIASNNENISQFSSTLSYPSNVDLKIPDGDYRFELKVYKNQEITVPASIKRECSKIPKTGLLGMFGVEEEKCFDVNLPSQKVSNLAYAGGYTNVYLTQDMLENAKGIRISASGGSLPKNVEEISLIYDQIDKQIIEVNLI